MRSAVFLSIMGLFVSPLSYAEGGEAVAAAGSPMGTMVTFGIIIVMMYFLMIRPQSKRAKEHRDLISKLEKGDEVLLASGILGKINRVTEQFFVVSIADGMEVKVQRQSITQALPKGTIQSI